MNIKHAIGIALLLAGAAWLWFFSPTKQSDTNILFVGTNAEFQPFTFIDKSSEIVGFDIDVAREVAQRLGKSMVLKNMSFDALIPEIQIGSIHMIAAGMTPTAERGQRVLFTNPHLEGTPLVLVFKKNSLKNNDIDTILKTKRIAANQGYTSEQYLISHGCPPHRVTLSGSAVSDGILALSSDQADYYIAAAQVVKPFFDQSASHDYELLTIPNTQETTALAVSKKFPELHKQVELALEQMRHDGTLQSIKEKWGLS